MSKRNLDGKNTSENDLNSLRERIDASRKAQPNDDDETPSGFAIGMRYATDFTANTLVGTALGYGADKLFGTAPWFMLAGLLLGFSAGLRSIVISAKNGQDASVPPQAERED